MKVAKELVAINHIIDALEYGGYMVEMQHDHPEFGFYARNDHNLFCMHRTWLRIYTIDFEGYMNEDYFGEALCSVKDQFNPAIGAQIAFNRAMKDMSHQMGRNFVKDIIADFAVYKNFEHELSRMLS